MHTDALRSGDSRLQRSAATTVCDSQRQDGIRPRQEHTHRLSRRQRGDGAQCAVPPRVCGKEYRHTPVPLHQLSQTTGQLHRAGTQQQGGRRRGLHHQRGQQEYRCQRPYDGRCILWRADTEKVAPRGAGVDSDIPCRQGG